MEEILQWVDGAHPMKSPLFRMFHNCQQLSTGGGFRWPWPTVATENHHFEWLSHGKATISRRKKTGGSTNDSTGIPIFCGDIPLHRPKNRPYIW